MNWLSNLHSLSVFKRLLFSKDKTKDLFRGIIHFWQTMTEITFSPENIYTQILELFGLNSETFVDKFSMNYHARSNESKRTFEVLSLKNERKIFFYLRWQKIKESKYFPCTNPSQRIEKIFSSIPSSFDRLLRVWTKSCEQKTKDG